MPTFGFARSDMPDGTFGVEHRKYEVALGKSYIVLGIFYMVLGNFYKVYGKCCVRCSVFAADYGSAQSTASIFRAPGVRHRSAGADAPTGRKR